MTHAIQASDIERVSSATVLKRDGSLKGYSYTAHLADGSTKVVRAIATRQYENAFFYDWHIASGKSDLAGYFSFGKKASGWGDHPIGSWVVDHAA